MPVNFYMMGCLYGAVTFYPMGCSCGAAPLTWKSYPTAVTAMIPIDSSIVLVECVCVCKMWKQTEHWLSWLLTLNVMRIFTKLNSIGGRCE